MRDIDEELEFGFVYFFQMLVLEHFLPHFVFFFCLVYENGRYAACHDDINDPCYAGIIPGHNDFSDPEPVYQEPSNSIRWQKKAVVLTNRRSYSATNDFVNTMRQFPNVTTMGDTTGGGSGLPFSSEIPNGWSIRFSASPMFDPDMNQLEFGIEPDVKVDMTSEDMQRGKDTIIETAIKKLKN